MPATGIQQTDVINAFSRLNPTDQSVDAGTFDPDTLIPTYPIDSTWLDQDLTMVYGAQSTTGINVQIRDVDYAAVGGTSPVNPLDNRFYSHIRVQTLNGTVTPIIFTLRWNISGTSYEVYRWTMASPATAYIGPVYVPSRIILGVYNETQGGAGDTANATFVGLQAKPGIPLPLIPPIHATTL